MIIHPYIGSQRFTGSRVPVLEMRSAPCVSTWQWVPDGQVSFACFPVCLVLVQGFCWYFLSAFPTYPPALASYMCPSKGFCHFRFLSFFHTHGLPPHRDFPQTIFDCLTSSSVLGRSFLSGYLEWEQKMGFERKEIHVQFLATIIPFRDTEEVS